MAVLLESMDSDGSVIEVVLLEHEDILCLADEQVSGAGRAGSSTRVCVLCGRVAICFVVQGVNILLNVAVVLIGLCLL